MARGTSHRVTSSEEIKDSCGTVWAVHVECTGSAGTVVIRDGGAGGTVMLSLDTPADPAMRYPIILPQGLKCNSTIYVIVNNAVAVVHYT